MLTENREDVVKDVGAVRCHPSMTYMKRNLIYHYSKLLLQGSLQTSCSSTVSSDEQEHASKASQE